jgi:hypothetical protein
LLSTHHVWEFSLVDAVSAHDSTATANTTIGLELNILAAVEHAQLANVLVQPGVEVIVVQSVIHYKY